MANRQRAEARRKAQAKVARQSGEGGSRAVMWIALVVVVVLGGGIAFFATRGDDDKTVAPQTTDSNSLADLPDSQPVTITGEPLPAYQQGGTDEAIGLTAPVLEGLDFQGDAVTIDAAKDGPYMVVFLAHWCVHCNAEVPRLLDWRKQGGVPQELKVVGVATAVSANAPNYPPAEWFSNKGWAWPVLVDQATGDGVAGTAAVAYGATGWPYIVIVGADGKVKARVSGEIEISDLQTIVDAALAA
ncbi:MAG: TlpA disulfide reductase family protein [Actinomycetota bacterium]|nr:TlpA disulfide reductase family protein [Actinomycetota bacterium]